MRTFASESVRKSLTGVRSDDPEVIPHTFVHFAARGVSQVMHMCFFCKMPSAESTSPPHLLGGHPVDKKDQAAY
jgi:hypothetical protein